LAAPQFEYLVSKLMGWNTTRHSPSLESARLRGSDAGHGEQGLAATEVADQGLLSSLRSSGQSGQVRSAGCVSWLEPIDDSRLIHRSVENWTATSVQASLRRQQQCRSQATTSATGRLHTRRRPSTGTSWLVDETIMVPRLRYVDPVPGTADSHKNYSNHAVSVFTMETHQNQSKLIISFEHGLQL